jgi:hypothetical protein
VDYNWNNIYIHKLVREGQKEEDCEDEYRPDFSLREFLRKGLYAEDDPADNEDAQAESRGAPSPHYTLKRPGLKRGRSFLVL